MPQKIVVQALRDIPLHHGPVKKGEKVDLIPADAQALIALGWAKRVETKSRTRAKEA